MTQSTNNEIKNITDLLVGLKSDIKETNQKIDSLTTTVNSIDKRLIVVETRLDNMKEQFSNQQKALDKIPDLAEKVGELKNWRQIAVIIITGTASTVFGWLLRSGRV